MSIAMKSEPYAFAIAARIPPVHERAQPPPPAADDVGGRMLSSLMPSTQRTIMLTEIFPFLHPENVEPLLPARLRVLADDLEKILDCAALDESSLVDAPLLVDWRAVLTPLGLRLTGFAAGHPIHGNRSILTSQIWVADPDGRWIRTLSRFYKLGISAEGEFGEGRRQKGFRGSDRGPL